MAYGAEFLNDSGGYLLNDRSDFLMLWESGSVSINETYGNGFVTNIDFPETVPEGIPLIVCIQPGQNLCWNEGYNFVDPPDNRGKTGIRIACESSVSLNYKVLVNYRWGLQRKNKATSWGMQLFGPDEDILYDSEFAEGKLLDIINITVPLSSDGEGTTYNHKQKDNAFYAINMFPFVWEQTASSAGDNYSNNYLFGFRQTGPTTLETKWFFLTENIPFTGYSYGDSPLNAPIMVIDDTGF